MEHEIELGKNSERGYWQQCKVCKERKYVHISVYTDVAAAGWSSDCPGQEKTDA